MIEKVIQIVADQCVLDAADITADTRLREDLGMDSVDLVELSMTLEEEFNLPEPQSGDELPEFYTVGDVAAYLEQFIQ